MNIEGINAIHAEFRRCGKNAKEWMSHNSVNEALRVYDALQDKPILRDEIEKHGTHKLKTIVTVATENTQEFWLKRLNEMSKSTLETYVREYKHSERSEAEGVPSSTPKIGRAKHNIKNGLPGEGQRIASQDKDMSNGEFCLGDSGDCEVSEDGSGTAGGRKTASIYMKLEVEVIEKLKRMKGDRDWNELMRDLLGGCAEERVGSKDDVEASTAVSKSADGGAEQHFTRSKKDV